jgi:hypothetical protein
MIHRLFTVYDQKAEVYLLPFTEKTIPAAIRLFSDTVQDEKHQFHRHAEDFTLFELGSYNDYNASYELLDTPRAVIKAIELLNQENGK